MFRISAGDPGDLRDVADFIDRVNRLDTHELAEARALFREDAPLTVSRAPGRLDLMGGIADYSGSLVLQMPIAEAALCAVQRVDPPVLQVVSLGGSDRACDFRCPLDELFPGGTPLAYAEAEAFFQRDSERSWAAYIAGCMLVLAREKQLRFTGGVNILIDSAVPEGKGVSSSAAIEVATMTALNAAFELELGAREIALLCQQVGNHVVGAPCGVMDQVASSCGEANRLLALLCQPADILGTIALPDDLRVWGIDSGVRHAVSGADYGSVRCGAFMGFTMLSAIARGLPAEARWGGYLANLPVHEFMSLEDELPVRIGGAEFLERYGQHADSVTRVASDQSYALRAPTAHPVFEHHRIQCFAALLQAPATPQRNALLGELMAQSHASYTRCGLGAEGIDQLVAAVRTPSADGARIYGAKITGGGSGGTVAVLGDANAGPRVAATAEAYAADTGRAAYLFDGSSPGAAQFGTLELSTD